jgi:glycerate kinase
MKRQVLIAPDKFKGTLPAVAAAQALAEGWRRIRPDDELVLLPIADGGDGTAVVLAEALPGSSWMSVHTVDAVGRPHPGRYLRAGDTAVVELAEICGIAGLDPLEPMDSNTLGLGIVLSAALRSGAVRLVVALGGSASTDGGTGVLSALGARFVGYGGVLPPGGVGLTNLARADLSRLVGLPPGGVEVLVDVTAPLFGPSGAATVFGPQKGASPDEVEELDRGLRRLAEVLGFPPDLPGAGAAGGTGYGLACWGACLVPGAEAVGTLIGLPSALASADLVITGEGAFDESTLAGKACGHVLASAGADRTFVVAGSVSESMARDRVLSLTDLAGSTEAALAEPADWLVEAGAQLATMDG